MTNLLNIRVKMHLLPMGGEKQELKLWVLCEWMQLKLEKQHGTYVGYRS